MALARTKPPAKNYKKLVDEFGYLKAQIADLQLREKELKEEFAATDVKEIEGELFRVTISKYVMSRVDWKAVAESFNPPERLIKKHTTPSDICRIEAKAR